MLRAFAVFTVGLFPEMLEDMGSWALEVSPVAHACSEVWIAVVERLLLSHMSSISPLD